MITIKSPTRVTLALDIVRKLDSGYHELGIVKHQISLADTITISQHSGAKDIVECDDDRVPCDDTNICVKACELVRKNFNIDERVRITIEKNIPVMGGLAGGSANAAATLQALAQLWGLSLSTEQFEKLGRELGMDVPFFFTGGTAFDSEATGVIKPIDTKLKFNIILAIPDFGVSTKEAYAGIDYTCVGKKISQTNNMITALENGNFNLFVRAMHNDFEFMVFKKFPRLKDIKNDLLSAGCVGVVMSGSGSTIIGILPTADVANKVVGKVDCETIVCSSF